MVRLFFDWSEVWALFIPLLFLLLGEKQPLFMKPVSIYIFLALFLNFIGDIIGDFYKHFPVWLQSNNPLYNIHSIARFICFSYFFIFLKHPLFVKAAKVLFFVHFLFLLIDFGFVEPFINPDHLSGNLLTAESYFLLVYCMIYYLSQLLAETGVLKSDKSFWIVTGLSLYVVINFFVFLFYVPMMTENPSLANSMWDVHNVAYILLSVFIAKAYHVPVRPYY